MIVYKQILYLIKNLIRQTKQFFLAVKSCIKRESYKFGHEKCTKIDLVLEKRGRKKTIINSNDKMSGT